jgi:hypothetical protein
MPYLLTKGSLSKIRSTVEEVKVLRDEGFTLAGECDDDGVITSNSVVLEGDDEPADEKKPVSAEKKALVDAALAAGVIDPKTEKPATEAALGRWGDERLAQATEEALKGKA